MDDLEKELQDLQSLEEDSADDDLTIFDRQSKLSKSRKKEKKERKLKQREKEIFGFLDDDIYNDEDESLDFLVHKKTKNKNEEIFDTEGKKKKENIDVKFKAEQAQLDRVLRDTETVYKNTKDLFDGIKESKARGSGKLMTDLIACLNSSNTTRLQVIKEKSALKKNIIDLKMKIKAAEKGDDEGEGDSRYFGVKYLNSLFKSGRCSAINSINKAHVDGYDPDNIEFEPPSNEDYINYGMDEDMSLDDMIDKRVDTSDGIRSKEADLFIKYEHLKPEVCIVKSQYNDTDISIIAIDKDGNQMPDDYPLPTLDSLGKITFNYEARTAVDSKGRVFRLILDTDI